MFGDRAFYRHVLTVVLPIIIQNTLTNIVSLLDNVMVGQVGTLPMSGVAMSGSLFLFVSICIWGSTAGPAYSARSSTAAGIWTGCGTFRFKLVIASLITAAAILLLGFCGAGAHMRLHRQ